MKTPLKANKPIKLQSRQCPRTGLELKRLSADRSAMRSTTCTEFSPADWETYGALGVL